MLSYSIETNKKYILKYSDTSPSCTPRKTYWDTIFKSLKNFGSHIAFQNIITDDSPLLNYDSNVLFNGYFQSTKYFLKNTSVIIDMLNIRNQQTECKYKYKELFSGDYTTVALHFRLGDYKVHSKHNILDSSYFVNAVEHIKKVDKNIKILYFCEQEDDEFVQTNYIPIIDSQCIKVSNDIKEDDQLLLISLCDWTVMSRSTFSWWGAYLKVDNESNVIYPDKWFSDNKHPEGLMLPSWTPISQSII